MKENNKPVFTLEQKLYLEDLLINQIAIVHGHLAVKGHALGKELTEKLLDRLKKTCSDIHQLKVVKDS